MEKQKSEKRQLEEFGYSPSYIEWMIWQKKQAQK